MAPTVSVLLTSYNQAEYLSEAVQSVLSQSFEDFEIVALDNGSTDGSAEILRQFAKIDKRIVLALRPDNQPVSRRFNEEVQLAKGRFISFLYSDDRYLPDKLERQVKHISDLPENYALVYSPALGYNQLTGTSWRYNCVEINGPALEPLLKYSQKRGTIDMLSPLTKRSCALAQPFNENLFAEGEVWYYRLAVPHAFSYDPDPTVVLRDHGVNRGKATRKNVEMTLVALDALGEMPDFPPRYQPLLNDYRARLLRDGAWSTVRSGGDPKWAQYAALKAATISPRIALHPRFFMSMGMSWLSPSARAQLNRLAGLIKPQPGNATHVEGYQ